MTSYFEVFESSLSPSSSCFPLHNFSFAEAFVLFFCYVVFLESFGSLSDPLFWVPSWPPSVFKLLAQALLAPNTIHTPPSPVLPG